MASGCLLRVRLAVESVESCEMCQERQQDVVCVAQNVESVLVEHTWSKGLEPLLGCFRFVCVDTHSTDLKSVHFLTSSATLSFG